MKLFDRKSLAAWTLMTLLASAPLFADDKGSTGSTGSMGSMGSMGNMSDEQIKASLENFQKGGTLAHLHHFNQKEVQLSKLALDKSQSKQVKDFAQRLMTDHQNADRKVMELAEAESLKLPDFQLAGYEKANMDQLEKMKGPQFDQAFVILMDTGHKIIAQELELARTTAKDPQIIGLIDVILPTIRDHQKMAVRLEKGESQMAGHTTMTGK